MLTLSKYFLFSRLGIVEVSMEQPNDGSIYVMTRRAYILCSVRVIRGQRGDSSTRTNKRPLGDFEVHTLDFLEIPKFNFVERSFPRKSSTPRIRIWCRICLAITFDRKLLGYKVRSDDLFYDISRKNYKNLVFSRS